MVGLTDHNIQLNARIRVGEDFGTILYIGPVESSSSTFYYFPELNLFLVFLRSKATRACGLVSNGTTLCVDVTTVLSRANIISKQGKKTMKNEHLVRET